MPSTTPKWRLAPRDVQRLIQRRIREHYEAAFAECTVVAVFRNTKKSPYQAKLLKVGPEVEVILQEMAGLVQALPEDAEVTKSTLEAVGTAPTHLLLIWEDFWGRLTAAQRPALIDHALHAQLQTKVDISEYNAILMRHGAWAEELQEAQLCLGFSENEVERTSERTSRLNEEAEAKAAAEATKKAKADAKAAEVINEPEVFKQDPAGVTADAAQ